MLQIINLWRFKRRRKKASVTVMPVRRDVTFSLPPDRIHDWTGEGVHYTMLENTMSLVIPVGERFFIDSVRYYRDQIQDAGLKQAVKAFIGQEAMHGREHDAYNAHMMTRSPSAEQFEERIRKLLNWFQDNTSPSFQLSITIALEHFTALIGGGHLDLLDHPAYLPDAEPNYRDLWTWHSLEETEHKSVAFDVWIDTQGSSLRTYLERIFGMTVASAIFWSFTLPQLMKFVHEEGKLLDLRGWGHSLYFNVINPGLMRRMFLPYLDYYRPGFHPWDHDNSHHLEAIEGFTRTFQKSRPASVIT